jgi:hypothetical protein
MPQARLRYGAHGLGEMLLRRVQAGRPSVRSAPHLLRLADYFRFSVRRQYRLKLAVAGPPSVTGLGVQHAGDEDHLRREGGYGDGEGR